MELLQECHHAVKLGAISHIVGLLELAVRW
jgi:hypothetical protein